MLQRVAQFTIVSKLGRGGMGVVFKAHDTKLQRQVALKLLPPEHVGDAERRARFLREARAAAAVAHANIATIYEIGQDDAGRVFIAMELVEGQTIRERLVAEGRLDVQTTMRVAREIARGLAKAHELRIVHRDLKPDNVMLTAEGGVKILDFGLAKLRDAPPSQRSLENAVTGQHDAVPITEAGVLLGTPGYLSPEQATGKPVDERTDVFSLGVMIFEMLTGKLPFRGSAPGELIVAAVRDDPRSLSDVAPDVPVPIANLVARCLAKSPDARFRSAQELIDAIDAIEKSASSDAFAATEQAPIAAPLRSGPPAAPARVGWSLRIAAGAAVVLSILLVGALVHRRASPRDTAAVAPIEAGSGTGLLDHPAPQCNDAARAAYRAALEASRGRGMELARQDMEKVTTLDPSCAEAHLRAALYSDGWNGRDHYNRAVLLRERLTERDREILDAYGPVFLHEPPDHAAVLTRLVNLARQRPRDAEILVLAGLYLWVVDPGDELKSYAQRAIDVDPGYSGAWQLLGIAHVKAAEYDAAARVFAQCETTVPASADCVYEAGRLAQWTGRCADMESHARMLLARTSDVSRAFLVLARALASNGAERNAVAEAIRQYAAGLPADGAHLATLAEARLAIAFGDFEGAEALLKSVEQTIERSAERSHHAAYAQQIFELHLETGRVASAVQVAETFAKRQRAWKGAIAEFYGTGEEGVLLVPRMLGIQAKTGKISAEQYKAQLDAWLPNAGIPGDERAAWIAKYVASAETPADAERALAMMPREDASLGGARMVPLGGQQSALTGRVFLLGGRPAEAITELRRSTRRCELLDSPLVQTQSHVWLAEALEATNDRAAACREYQVVLSRWKHARPPSLSARKAEARRKALGCELVAP